MLEYTCRPISAWPQPQTQRRERSRFKATGGATMRKLESELKHLGARRCIIEIDLADSQIRLDGKPYAGAKVLSTRAAVYFDSKYGPLVYRCDRFDSWDCNVRAIALTLERLRLAELYGVTRRGEQYQGFRALPPGNGGAAPIETAMTVEQAAAFIDDALPTEPYVKENIVADRDHYRAAYRSAARALHPDTGGDEAKFKRLQEAKRVLDRHHGFEV